MHRRWIASLLLVASCDVTSTPTPTPARRYNGPSRVTLGAGSTRVTLRLDRFGMQVADRAGNVVLDTLDATPTVPGEDHTSFGALGATRRDVEVRAPIIEGWDHVTIREGAWFHGSAVESAVIEGDSASIDLVDPSQPRVTMHLDLTVLDDEVRLDTRVYPTGASSDAGITDGPDRTGLSFTLPSDEHFFGLGERYVTVDHRGQRFECWLEEGGIGGGERAQPGRTNPFPNGAGMTHLPVPFVISTRGYGLWLDTTARTGFDMGAELPTAWRIYADEPTMRLRLLVHRDPKDTLAHFTRLTGRAHAPAPWVFGPRRRVDHGTMVGAEPEWLALRTHHVPTTMADDTTHFLPHAGSAGREEELRAWNANLRAYGFKSIAYFNANVSASRPAAADLLAYGRAHDLFVHTDDGAEFVTSIVSGGAQPTVTIDLSKPEAAQWWTSLQQHALDLGYDGWMLDFGEYIPPNARLADGRSGWLAHNAFPLLMQRVSTEFLRRARGEDYMFYARAGDTGTQALVPIVWSGDPSSSFEPARGLPANVRAGINSGLSGIPYWGSDISGYTCLNDPPADKDVYLRWAEFGALSPDMHDENACSGAPASAPPKWTLWSDAETTEVYGRYARLHTRLIPYLYAAAKEAEATGLPIMRHPIFYDPMSPDAWRVQYEYWFGPALYVAPVVERAARTRTLWLPPGPWIDWWTLESLDGGRSLTRNAPLDVLPLFQRGGTLVAMLDPSVETLVPDTRSDVVSADEMRDVLDVRGYVTRTAPTAHADLADGTALDVASAEAQAALPQGFAVASDEAMLATCSRCARLDTLPTGGVRLRVSTESAMTGNVTAGGVTLRHGASRALRVRWDVAVR